MKEEELLSLIALTEVPGLGPIGARQLLSTMGSATDIFRERKNLTQLVPGTSERLVKALDNPEAFHRAEKEMRFVTDNRIECLSILSDTYPSRMRECDDAPILLYYKGNADLNARKAISIVGTRNATPYGKQLCETFLADLKKFVPDLLIISGLAYGIDIHAHRTALANNLPTVAVLAHGLDRIYPAVHRATAVNMLEQGGLLTEYLSGTTPDRPYFIQRNRIIAGMADATIVIESALKGGSLITAKMAGGYHRDCFAFPGRADDTFSQGCNKLIATNQAGLVQTAEDFIQAMCWDTDIAPKGKSPATVQRQLFPELTEEEQSIADLLQQKGELQINELTIESNLPINKLTALLFELEMKGVVRTYAGGMYRLV